MQVIQLSEHFTYRKLLRFTLPSIVMMIFVSIYSVVDGIFVSNFVGKTPFAAVNLIMPFLQMLGIIGLMLGTGGSALIAKTLGEGDKAKANSLFSMFIYLLAGCSIVILLIGRAVIKDVAIWLGAEGEMIRYCVEYSRILLVALPAFVLQYAFQAFWVTAEKPNLGLVNTICAGVTNIVLDYLFIAKFGWGLKGAAYATLISQYIGGVIPIVYFALPNSSLLRLTRFSFDGKSLFKACLNGSSEMVTNVSVSIVCMLYNFQLMRYIGENGVAAYGVIMYTYFIFLSIFIGFSMGSAPIVSFHYGAKNNEELKSLLRKSLVIVSFMGLITTALALALATPLSKVFVGYDRELFLLTKHAFTLFSLSFLFAGVNVYASAFFTALNNGLVSAGISFSRTIIFECGAVLILPLLFGINGIWLSISVAEVFAIILSFVMFALLRKRYGY